MTDLAPDALGSSFNSIADEYDRHRPGYPDELVDRACAAARVEPGDPVLEIGCGSGQLTRVLLARGLRVTAVEPGDRLAAIVRRELTGAGELRIVGSRLESARLPSGTYRCAFSASAIHWVDPDVAWRMIADALTPNGTLALLQFFGLRDPAHADDQDALLEIIRRHAPQVADRFPRYRDLLTLHDGARERRGNVSELWSWLGAYDLGRADAAELFDDAELTVVPTTMQRDADELSALVETMSFWSRVSEPQRESVRRDNRQLQERLGRPLRASMIAALVTARRRTG